MFKAIKCYLAKRGVKYIKPEKAGPHEQEMRDLKALGQAARKEMLDLSEAFEIAITPFRMTRVSNWANQAQVCRPHFWTYFYGPEDKTDDVAMAIRLYGDPGQWGISLEVSFVERHRSENTLSRQARVLNLPIQPPLYYLAQENRDSHPYAGTEANRQVLKQRIESGEVRKVLVKYDIPVTNDISLDQIVEQLVIAFETLRPYVDITKD